MAKKASTSKSAKTPEELKSGESKAPGAPKKAAAKKASAAPKKTPATKPAAEKTTPLPAKKSSRKAAKAVATPRRKTSPAKSAAAAAAEAAERRLEQQAGISTAAAQAGSIKPSVKRPAYLPPANGNVLVRQQRIFAEASHREEPQQADYELPVSYDRTAVSALVRDPEWLFVYWEIAPRVREELGLGGRSGAQLILRLYDVTGIDTFDGTNAISRTDIPVNEQTASWYVHVPQTGRRYVVELGVTGARGEFLSVARSRPVDMPSAKISGETEWEWGAGDEEIHHQILRLSGGADIPLHLSSAEFVNELRRRFLEESAGFSGELFSGALMGSELASLGVGGRALERERGFWLTVDTEVIVYGATEPNAKVRFMGREIKLGTDGTFGIRMALPEGTLEFPIEATSADEAETRSVCPVVNRRTL